MISLPNDKDLAENNCKRIRDSWIYDHFDAETTKIVLYVNACVPINQNLHRDEINQIGNHCVVVKGIKRLTVNDKPGVEFLEIENWDANSEETSLIPVDHPFFEEVQTEVNRIFGEYRGSELYRKQLNTYGKKLAEIKYGSLEDDWFDLKNESQADTEDTEEIPYKYEMVFIKRQSRCFQLKFID